MNKKIRKIVEKFEILKVFSVILAIILFLTVNPLFSNPIWNDLFESSIVVQDVKVNIEYDKDNYVIEGIPDQIDVRVSGSENEIKNYEKKSNNTVATINLSGYPVGTTEISADDFSFNIKNVTITPTQNTFTIYVQDKISKSQSVSVSYINGDQLTQGLMLESSSLDYISVNVNGGTDDVESVTTVLALADLTKFDINATRGTQSIEVPLVAYNANGNRVDGVTFEPSTVTLEQSYSVQSVTLPVVYEYINNDTKMYVSTICPIGQTDCDENYQEEVQVYGNSEKINDLSSITYQVDLTGVDKNGGDVSGVPVLEADVFVVDENKHDYHVEFEEGDSVTIEGVSVGIINLDDGFTAVAPDANQAKVDVQIEGANSQIDGLTQKDVSVYADLTDYTKPGIYTVPIQVQRDKNLSYTLETQTIEIEIKEKTTSGDSDE